MRIAFTRWRSGGLLNRPSPRKRLLPKKKTSSGFEFVSGLADGASAMPAKWSRPVFSFRFYEGKISRALIVIRHSGAAKVLHLDIFVSSIKGGRSIVPPTSWSPTRPLAGCSSPGMAATIDREMEVAHLLAERDRLRR